MKNKTIAVSLVELLLVLIFNIVFFLTAGFDNPVSVWIAYGFIHAAFLMVVLTPALTEKSKYAYLFGLSVSQISSVYFAICFVMNIIFIAVGMSLFVIPLIANIVLLGVYVVILGVVVSSNEKTAKAVQTHDAQVSFIKQSASRVKMLCDSVNDSNINRKIEHLYDLINSSPSASNESVKGIEETVSGKIFELESAIRSGRNDIVESCLVQLTSLFEERNRMLRL